MLRRRITLAALAIVLSEEAAIGAALAPHRAVYDLSLATVTPNVVEAEGRIAMRLDVEGCNSYSLDYRLVAKFFQEQELLVTDQQTLSRESTTGDSFEFTTKTFVDGTAEEEVSGEAAQSEGRTIVTMRLPTEKTFDLPLSMFPMQHTSALIDRALAGETIVESRLFDGGEDGEKLLSSTAIIAPWSPGKPSAPQAPSGAAAAPPEASPALAQLSRLKAWRISEAYFNSDSDPDGLPIFETSYVLYENGVSDDLTLDFGDYALRGGLSSLELTPPPDCR